MYPINEHGLALILYKLPAFQFVWHLKLPKMFFKSYLIKIWKLLEGLFIYKYFGKQSLVFMSNWKINRS